MKKPKSKVRHIHKYKGPSDKLHKNLLNSVCIVTYLTKTPVIKIKKTVRNELTKPKFQ